MSFDIRHNEKVVLVALPERPIERLKVGMKGKVLGLRAPDQYLIKFEGRSGPVSVCRNEIERAK